MDQFSKQKRDLLSREEIQKLHYLSDFKGMQAVLFDWFVIFICFVWVAYSPNALSILVSLILVGGRQLALSILMHECAHKTLFKTVFLNEFIGKWFCAAPTFNDLERYREHHLRHHRLANTPQDPDLGLVTPYPCGQWSFLRKCLRDLSGITGLKRGVAIFLMNFDFITYTISTGARPIDRKNLSFQKRCLDRIGVGFRRSFPMFLTQAALLFGLFLWGHEELYLLWLGAYLGPFSLFLRLRAIAEHACLSQVDLRLEGATRTTWANGLARMTVAPHRVNFHWEHHLFPMIPYFSLPKIHSLALSRGALTGDSFEKGYFSIFKKVTSQ